MTTYIGGNFAPPLSDEKLAGYQALITALPGSPVKEAMQALHNCCAKWWELPESVGAGKPHGSGRGTIVNLDADISKALFEHIPWDEELKMFAELFEEIPNATAKPLRDAAFHLLWHGIELSKDREPLTNDKL